MPSVEVQPGGFMSRVAASFAVVLAGFAALAPATARADSGPVIVIPSRPGVPVVINGRDASYAVVEGDWGLSRPGAVPVTVIGGSPILPNPVYTRRQFVSSEIWSRAGARPQRSRTGGRSRAARSGRELLALLVDVVRRRAGERHAAPEPCAADQFRRRRQRAGDDHRSSDLPQDFNPSVIVDPRRRRRHH